MSSQLLDLGRENVRLKQEIVGLRGALEESVKLQGHYAELLNMYDGGHRIVFLSAADWMARLAMTTEQRVQDAERRAQAPPCVPLENGGPVDHRVDMRTGACTCGFLKGPLP